MATLTFSVELDVAEIAKCDELGRTTRAYVSGYQRARMHRSRLVRGERRCLVANFNGALPPARTIASVTWRTNQPMAAYMADAGVVAGGREVRVDVTAGAGCALVKCEVTLDNGEVYNQLFDISVQSGPWFEGEAQLPTGPRTLTAVAA